MPTIQSGKSRSDMQSCLVLSGTWQLLRLYLPRRRAAEKETAVLTLKIWMVYFAVLTLLVLLLII